MIKLIEIVIEYVFEVKPQCYCYISIYFNMVLPARLRFTHNRNSNPGQKSQDTSSFSSDHTPHLKRNVYTPFPSFTMLFT